MPFSMSACLLEYPKPQTTIEMLMEELTGTKDARFKGTALEGLDKAFRSWSSAESGKAYARIPYEIILK